MTATSNVLVAASAALCLWAFSPVSSRAQTTPTAYGERVAHRNCAMCHAIAASGDSPNPKAPRFRELHKRFVVQDLEDRLLLQLMSHHKDMPQFRLSMEELQDLIAYLKSIQTDQHAAAGSGSNGRTAG